jgi:hypothetical protein
MFRFSFSAIFQLSLLFSIFQFLCFSLQFSAFGLSSGKRLQKDFFFSLQSEKLSLHLAAILL